jgi:hypothetical protein
MSYQNDSLETDTPTTNPGHVKHDYAVLPDGTDRTDVEYGERYWALVRNTTDHGVFVSLSGDPDVRDGAWGAVFMPGIPGDFHPDDFMRGDEVGVMLYDRKDNGDLGFELVAGLRTLRNLTFETLHPSAPTGDDAAVRNAADVVVRTPGGDGADADAPEATADAGGADGGADADAGDAPALGADALDARLRAIEERVAALASEQADARDDVERRVDALAETVEAAVVDRETSDADAAAPEMDAVGAFPLVQNILTGLAGDATVANVDYTEAGDEVRLAVTFDRGDRP